MITTAGDIATPQIQEFDNRAKFAEVIRNFYEDSVAGLNGTSQSIFAFEGRRVRVVGSPLRALVFPDGTRIPLAENDPEASDDHRLLPPPLRGVFVRSPEQLT